MTFNPAPKNPYKKRKPTRKKRGEFSKETRDRIIERDEGLCRVCRGVGTQIHHCYYKSSGGRGVYSNGILLCQACHADIHNSKAKANFWRDTMAKIYGNDYYKDDWD